MKRHTHTCPDFATAGALFGVTRPIWMTRNKFYAGRKVYFRVLAARDVRYEGFRPIRVSGEFEYGPAVWLH